jgi:uncharacterized protein
MKENIKRIILEWQEGIGAKLFPRHFALDYIEEINAVIGLRRSGKTYFIFSEIKKLLKNGLPATEFMYINFDDERLADLKGSDLNLLIEAYFELFPENREKKIYLFFDEIQALDRWHLFVKRLYEQKKYHITLTGSSSKFLSSEIATELRGRTRTANFFPLTFNEFLEFKNFQIPRHVEFSEDRFRLINYAVEFLKWGGFPRVVTETSDALKKVILKDYLEMIIFKDIAERYSVRNTHLLKLMINYVLTNFAAEFSVNRFLKKFQKEYRLNKDTVFSYFSYLEDVGFLYYLPRFSYKFHQRYVTKKNYIADNGFITLLAFRGMEIPGRLLENLVFSELVKRRQQLFYFRDANDYECDFIVTEDEQAIGAIQVCQRLTSQNREREIRGIISALKAFGIDKGIIVTNDSEESIQESAYQISVVPYWKWMISASPAAGETFVPGR